MIVQKNQGFLLQNVPKAKSLLMGYLYFDPGGVYVPGREKDPCQLILKLHRFRVNLGNASI